MTLLNKNIKDARIAAGLTQTELAKKIGVKQQTIQKYENGIVTNIPSDKIEAIAKALNVTPAYLMGWEFEQLLNNQSIWADESDRQFIMERKDYCNLPVDKQEPAKEPTLDEQLEGIEFALWGEIKELDDDAKQDILDFVRFKKEQKNKKADKE